jgi:hypothetical protein
MFFKLVSQTKKGFRNPALTIQSVNLIAKIFRAIKGTPPIDPSFDFAFLPD